MSKIIFGSTIDLINAGTPSTGEYMVAYDLDGILKQKDEFGIITPISDGGTPSLYQVLSNDNNTISLDIIMGTSTSIKTSNGGGQIDLDYGTNSVLISTDNSNLSKAYLNLSDMNINMSSSTLNISSQTISVVSGDGRGMVYDSDYSSGFVNNSLVTKLYVDTVSEDYLRLSGGTMSGNIEMGIDKSLVSIGGSLLTLESNDGSFYLDRDSGLFKRNWIWFTDNYNGKTYWSEIGVNSGSTNSGTSSSLLLYNADESNGWSNYSSVFLEKTKLSIYNGGLSSKNVSIVLEAENDTITTHGTSNFKGIVYDNDYSLNYVDRSLVDKEYVDNGTASIYNYVDTSAPNFSNTDLTFTQSRYHELGGNTVSMNNGVLDLSTGGIYGSNSGIFIENGDSIFNLSGYLNLSNPSGLALRIDDGGIRTSLTKVDSDYIISYLDYNITCLTISGTPSSTTYDYTLTLPQAFPDKGLTYRITNSGYSRVLISTNFGDTIGTTIGVIFLNRNESVELVSDGLSNWILASRLTTIGSTNYTQVTSTYSIKYTDYTIHSAGSETYSIFLPDTSGELGLRYEIKNTGPYVVYLTTTYSSGTFSHLIDGMGTQSLTQWDSISLVSGYIGSNPTWIIVG